MPNYNTVNEYNLTSAQSDFSISFDYQKQSYVSVKVEDASFVDVSSNYSGVFTDATTYQFQDVNGNPELIPSGYRVTFTRDTDISDDLFTFAAGTVIRPDALGESLKTLRDYTEEKNDQTSNVTITIANDAITTATQTATTKASEASASATAAAGSASAASTSATNAATSETNAATSETNAAASAAAASTSETNAGTSETNAAASAAAAATSETNASASATAASTSETNAATSATNAAASATAAEAARDAVLDVFLGSFADDLAVDAYLSGVSYTKDIGDLYLNTTDGFMKVYTGSGWVDVANTVSSDLAAISATAAQTAQTAAEAALNTFVNRYLGTYTNVNNDDAEVTAAKGPAGDNVIDAGDIYFDSTNTILKYYDGNGWQPAAAVSVLNTTNLGNVGDVDYTNAPQTGDYLYRNASNQWERRAVGDVKTDLSLPTNTVSELAGKAPTSHSIGTHNDVDTSSIASGELLRWDGASSFVPTSLTEDANGNVETQGDLTVNGDITHLVDSTTGSSTLWSSINTGTNVYQPMPGELFIKNDADGATDSIASIFFDAGQSSAGIQASTARIAALREDDTDAALVFACRRGGSQFENMRITSDGEVLIGYTTDNGAYKLQVNGQIFATSSTIATSDQRYKENVIPLTAAIDTVKALNPVQFDWKEHPVHEFDRSTSTTGFIAQEVQSALADKPWVNSLIKSNDVVIEPKQTDENGNVIAEAVTEEFLGIAEGNLIAVLTAAIQEQQTQIEALEARVAALETA